MLTLGIDDAGRGPVIGPMILAGCVLDEESESYLKKLGVRDSKQLTNKRREFLAQKIKDVAKAFEIITIFPEKIDGMEGKRTKLNELEAEACAEIINKLNVFGKIKVVVDCPSPALSKWCDYLKARIENLSNLVISCEHKADRNHVSVSAASILAKCKREEEMSLLKKKYGDEIGSGYCSDPDTMKFLQKFGEKYKDDGIFRKTWITWQKVELSFSQKKLEI